MIMALITGIYRSLSLTQDTAGRWVWYQLLEEILGDSIYQFL